MFSSLLFAIFAHFAARVAFGAHTNTAKNYPDPIDTIFKGKMKGHVHN